MFDKAYILEREQWIPAALERVFEFFKNPFNLAAITPGWLHFQINSSLPVRMEYGAEITYTIRWLGIPVRWYTRITKYEPPYCFIDEQIKGPYRTWMHLHTFEEKNGGVLMTDRVTYRLPFGPAGCLIHRLQVRRQLEEIFNYRRDVIANVFNVKE